MIMKSHKIFKSPANKTDLFADSAKRMHKFEQRNKLMEKTNAIRNKTYNVAQNDTYKTYSNYALAYGLMKKYLKNLKGKKILRLGSSISLFMNFLQENHKSEAIGLDLLHEHIGIGKNAGLKKALQSDATKLPFKNNSINCIYSEHFFGPSYLNEKELAKITTETARVLKPKGLFMISNFGEFDFSGIQEIISSSKHFNLIEIAQTHKSPSQYTFVLQKMS